MATVKITERIRSAVLQSIVNAHEPRNADLEKRIGECITFTDIVETYIQETGGWDLYKKSYHWMERRESIFVAETNGVYSPRYYSISKDDITKSKLEFNPVSKSPYIPQIPDRINLPLLQPKVEKIILLIAKQDELIEEIKGTKNSVEQVLNAYPTINIALKMHPELEAVLPQWVKTELVRKVVKSSSAAIDKQVVNLDGLKMVTLLNALNGAK